MSESFQAALDKVNYGKYIDEIQDELKRIMLDIGPGRNPQEVEATQLRLQELIRKQAKDLARDVGFSGNHVFIFMAATAIISTAWVSYTLRKETSDMSKSPEDRLTIIDMLDALELALGKVIAAATNYADVGGNPSASTPEPSKG